MTLSTLSSLRSILVGLLAVVLAERTSAQTDIPSLELRRTIDGRLILSPKGDASRAVIEATDSLTPPIIWGPAKTTDKGAIDGSAPLRVYRLRLLPVPPAPASSAHLGVLGFKEAPPRVRSGETVQFVVTGDAGTQVDARWSVNGDLGGSIINGFITVLGWFTAPPTTTDRTVEIRAEVTASNGDRALAQTLIEILPPLPPRHAALIPASAGGILHSEDSRAIIEVPPGALAQDISIEIVAAAPGELALVNADANQTRDVLARVEFLPDGTTFDPPATVRVKLDRYFEPGTRLPLEIKRITPAGVVTWEPAGIEGEVELDGVTLTFLTPHFSTFQVAAPQGPLVPNAPTVTAVIPARLAEGALRPILLRGTGFGRSLNVTAHEPGNLLNPTPLLEVRQTAFDPTAPNEFGVLLKSLPDTNLSAGTSKSYVLRLAYAGSGAATTVNITVDGLGEFILGAGQTTAILIPTVPASSRHQATFSRIEIGTGAILESRVRVLEWQATDRVEIYGQVVSTGLRGVDALLANGGGTTSPAPGGAGNGGNLRTQGSLLLVTDATGGSPVLTPDLTQHLPGTLDSMFGQPGATGFDPGLNHYADPLVTVSEAMYAYFDAQLRAGLPGRDPSNHNFWRVLSESVTQTHSEGRKGHQGAPGGFRPSGSPGGFRPNGRIIEPGGGGGGGGASYRLNSVTSASGPGGRIGLGGGSGGSGGGAISLVAGGELFLGTGAQINTSGGSGGDGGAPIPQDFSNPLAIGRGGGGGPGGAGTIHLLAGERLTRANGAVGLPFLNSAGSWGAGGFLMDVGTHLQASPPSWLQPVAEPPALSEGELAGPDFSTAGRGLRTGIQTGRAVEAFALNPYSQGAVVMVENADNLDIKRYSLTGLNPNARRVRMLLTPGHNRISFSSTSLQSFLNRDVLVLNTPDTDGDGLSDAEELALGYNPNLADSNGDGVSDAEEWLADGGGVPGDLDGDGFPDAVELAFGSDPRDSSSTPLNTNLGSGSNRAIIAASWPGVQVIRPAVGPAQGVPFSLTVAQPQSVRVERR